MHVDTGHNFPEVLEFRDRRVAELGVAADRRQRAGGDRPRARCSEPPDGTRNRIQTPVLLDAVEKHGFTALFGGARRDEDKARAKERVFSFRDEFGQWDPKNQRPELWNLYNGRIHLGESIRVFPLSNWTELDIWQYIAARGDRDPVDLLRARARGRSSATGCSTRVNEFCRPRDGEQVHRATVRYRTVGDANLTAAVRSRRRHGRGGHRRDRGDPDHRARRHPRRRQGQRGRHGGPQEGGVLLTMDILRFATAGSVDDGKSTLIGRLLYDTQGDLRGPVEAVERASQDRGDDYVNLALLTDGLRAEREQGITIDVAYRYFATPRRKFIIADTPGHIQYTRNMVTGASTADLAIVLVDARKGMRRAEPAARVPRHAAAGAAPRASRSTRWTWSTTSQEVYERIRDEFTAFAAKLNVPDLTVDPGLGAARRQRRHPLGEHALVRRAVAAAPPRARARRQRPQPDRRALPGAVRDPPAVRRATTTTAATPGTVAGGVLQARRRGAWCCPAGFTTPDRRDRRPRDGPVDEAFPPMSVTVRLEDDLDVSRGDMICRPHNAPQVTQDLDAMVCWMADEPLRPRQKLAIKHTTRTVRAHGQGAAATGSTSTRCTATRTAAELGLNDIGRVRLRTTQPLFVDDYRRNRATGGFILIDEATNAHRRRRDDPRGLAIVSARPARESGCRVRRGSGDRFDVREGAAGVPGGEGSYEPRGAVELDAAVADGLGPGELPGVPFDEGFGFRRDVEVLVEAGVCLADLGVCRARSAASTARGAGGR